jgi:hypothetical protein
MIKIFNFIENCIFHVIYSLTKGKTPYAQYAKGVLYLNYSTDSSIFSSVTNFNGTGIYSLTFFPSMGSDPQLINASPYRGSDPNITKRETMEQVRCPKNTNRDKAAALSLFNTIRSEPNTLSHLICASPPAVLI